MVLYPVIPSESAIICADGDGVREVERMDDTERTLSCETTSSTPLNVAENTQMSENVTQRIALLAPENGVSDAALEEPQSSTITIDSSTFRCLSSQILRVQIDRLRGINQQLLTTSGPLEHTPSGLPVEEQSRDGITDGTNSNSASQRRNQILPIENGESEGGTEPENGNDETDLSLYEELKNLYRRCHQSLPFLSLFLLHFAYQHTLGIFILVTGSLSIMGLDQRLRGQIVLKENVNIYKVFGIAAICIIDIFALACVNGDINPYRQFKKNLFLQTDSFDSKSDVAVKDLFWKVIGAILVNGTIIQAPMK